MYKIDTEHATAEGFFQDDDPANGQIATEVPAAWLTELQMEICNVITKLGGTLAKGTRDQLYTQLAKKFAALDTSVANASSVMGANLQQFDLVVDSNDKLALWAADTLGSYPRVLIKKGTWTSSAAINLTSSGTKVIVGEAGSQVTFSSSLYGFYYTTMPTTDDYYIKGVSVSTSGSSYGFLKCRNLANCVVNGSASATSDSSGFAYCYNLENCSSIFSTTGTASGKCFNNCVKLLNCTATANSSSSVAVYGFYVCNKIINCISNCTGTDTGDSIGFMSCLNATDCEATNVSAKGLSIGYMSCQRMKGCISTATTTGTGSAYGFYSCTYMVSCYGSGGTYDFSGCNSISQCYGVHGTFDTSYAGSGQNAPYLISGFPGESCSAWGLVSSSALVSSKNVASVTINSGAIAVVFTKALPDTNYAIVHSDNGSTTAVKYYVSAKSTTGFTLTPVSSSSLATLVSFSVFR